METEKHISIYNKAMTDWESLQTVLPYDLQLREIFVFVYRSSTTLIISVISYTLVLNLQ